MDSQVRQGYDACSQAIDADGQNTSLEIPYVVSGVSDESEALSKVLANVPKSEGGLSLSSIEVDSRQNDTTYKVKAVYKKNESGDDDDESADATVSFDCGGGTKHLTHSYHQRIAYGKRKAGGAIGWNGKTGSEMEITGVDIPTAQLRESYTKVMKLSRITTSFKRKVASLVGKVNSGSFKGWSPGEVMFLGMSYSCPAKKSTKVSVTFNFAIQPNESGVEVGGHTVSKKGFEYIWALSSNSTTSEVPEATVEAIYVDTVCESASFSALGV